MSKNCFIFSNCSELKLSKNSSKSSSVNESLSCSATGSKDVVHQELSELISRYKPDELIITGAIHNHEARLYSYSIVAEVLGSLTIKSVAA